MPKRKVDETLEFVVGLLESADAIDRALSGELEPRRALHEANKRGGVSNLTSREINELGKYQGRVVLMTLAAELALKYVWERDGRNTGGAPGGHKLQKCFNKLLNDDKEAIRREYKDRISGLDSPGKDWETVEGVFRRCNSAFEDWRYLVEEGSYPDYIMHATFLYHATRSVIDVARQREGNS